MENNSNKNTNTNLSIPASNSIIDFTKLSDLCWSIADLIRDKMDGDTRDYMDVTLPFLLLKRFLDVREEFIEERIKDTIEYTMEGDLLKAIEAEKNTIKIYNVTSDNPKMYAITWSDIMSYPENPNAEKVEYRLKKYPEFTIETTARNKQEFLGEIVNSFSDETIHKIFQISRFAERIKDLKKFKEEHFKEVISEFNTYVFNYKNAPSDIFSDTYMYLIERFAEGAGKKGGEFFTPRPLCKGAIKILNPKLNDNGTTKVADITSGSATFLIETGEHFIEQIMEDKGCDRINASTELNNRTKFYLQEKAGTSLILGEMNLLLKNMTEFNAYNANSITEYNDNIGKEKGTMDYIVGNPPYGLKDYGLSYFGPNASKKKYIDTVKESRWTPGIAPKGEGEMAFVETFYDMLKEGGRGVIVLPLGTLFKDSTKHIRQYLVDNGMIEGLVLLPDNMFTTTSIPVVMWVIRKSKISADSENQRNIFIVNASEHYTKKGKFNEWNQEETINAYHDKSETEGFSGYISYEDIVENDYNLSVQRYIFKDEPEEDIDIVALMKDISELETKIDSNKKEMKPIIEQIIKLQENKKNA